MIPLFVGGAVLCDDECAKALQLGFLAGPDWLVSVVVVDIEKRERVIVAIKQLIFWIRFSAHCVHVIGIHETG